MALWDDLAGVVSSAADIAGSIGDVVDIYQTATKRAPRQRAERGGLGAGLALAPTYQQGSFAMPMWLLILGAVAIAWFLFFK